MDLPEALRRGKRANHGPWIPTGGNGGAVTKGGIANKKVSYQMDFTTNIYIYEGY